MATCGERRLGGLAPWALVLACTAALASAQDDATSEASLRARLAIEPTDLHTRCQLGYVLVRAERWSDAQSVLASSLDSAPAPSSAVERARRGACLYNLGRAEEGLGHADLALARYRASLALRPNGTVQARLDALSHAPPSSTTAAAPGATTLDPAIAARCHLGGGGPAVIEADLPLALAEWPRALLVRVGPFFGDVAAHEWQLALVSDADCRTADVYADRHGDLGDDVVRVSASVEGPPTDPRIVTRVHLEHIDDSRVATAHRRWTSDIAAIAWLDASAALQVLTLPIANSLALGDGAPSAFQLALAFDARGRTVLTSTGSPLPPEIAAMVGTHTLPMREVPSLFDGEIIPAALVRALRGRLLARTRVVARVVDPALTALLLFTVSETDTATTGLYIPVIASGGRWLVSGPIAQFYPPSNDSWMGEDSFVPHASIRPILAAGAPALVVEWEHRRAEYTLGDADGADDPDDADAFTLEATSVIWPDGARARSWTLPRRVTRDGTLAFTLTISFDAGNVTVSSGEGTTPRSLRAALGTHSVTAIQTHYSLLGAGEPAVTVPTP